MKHLSRESLLLLFLTILSRSPTTTLATPFPPQFNSRALLIPRSCDTPCGFYGQLCCLASETCATNYNGQAECTAEFEPRDSSGGGGGDSGKWETYTTTFVQTDYATVTSTGSRQLSAPTSRNNDDAKCENSLGESACGNICCSAAQACKSPGHCVESGSSPIETPPPGPSGSGSPQPSNTASSGAPSPTVPFIPPVGPSGSATGTAAPITGGGDGGGGGSSGGLSGGAIAGIVIGTLAGLFILLLLCACFCVGSVFDRIRALLGMGRTRHSSYTGSTSYGSGARPHRPGRTWFGAGRHSSSSRSSRSDRPGGLFGLGKGTTFGLIAGAIAVALGLKKRHDRRRSRRTEKTDSRYGPGNSHPYTSSSSSSSSGRGGRRDSRARRSRSRSRSKSRSDSRSDSRSRTDSRPTRH